MSYMFAPVVLIYIRSKYCWNNQSSQKMIVFVLAKPQVRFDSIRIDKIQMKTLTLTNF